jgi:hypothetical protein
VFRGSGALFDALNIGDPVVLSARKARINVFAFQVGGGTAKPRLIGVLDCVDIDSGVEAALDFAGN